VSRSQTAPWNGCEQKPDSTIEWLYIMGKWVEIVPECLYRTIPAGAIRRWSICMLPGGVGTIAPAL